VQAGCSGALVLSWANRGLRIDKIWYVEPLQIALAKIIYKYIVFKNLKLQASGLQGEEQVLVETQNQSSSFCTLASSDAKMQF
jgi:hypothetical protein